jgi:hypothetical protein
MKTANSLEGSRSLFAEIEVAETKAERKPLPQAQPIAPRVYDPLRARFRDMRMIADYAPYAYQNDSWLFYEQAKFMADVTDDYPHRTAFSAFYPYYQRMGYEQLRTYFTWRTAVREGLYPFAGASYLFLYIYELLSCIGVSNPQDGLARLKGLWPRYREAVPSLDQYLPDWVRDFHIYYGLPYSAETVETEDDSADIWLRRSGYDVNKSKFYTENAELMKKYITAVFGELRMWCKASNAGLEDLLLYDVNAGEFWKPFSQALFYPQANQPNRRVEMPGRETYVCNDNRWTLEKARPFAGTREWVGYIIRKTESRLRVMLNHKHKLSADAKTLVHAARKLKTVGLTVTEMDVVIEKAITDFHREMNRVEVTVNAGSLVRIREEALDTQERLTVEEMQNLKNVATGEGGQNFSNDVTGQGEQLPINLSPIIPPAVSPGWGAFFDSLTVVERGALKKLCHGETDLKEFADTHGFMLEVLTENINEKAADIIGDNILNTEDGLVIYEEYREDIKNIFND